uniref:EF-hand domain-containing protein n=1 Tax=Meloidogyne hapla TaxID=6305 RepID=A0A1I8BFQ4_MELHA
MGKDEIDSASIASFLRTAKDVSVPQFSQLVAAVQQGFQTSPEILFNQSLEPPRFENAFSLPLEQNTPFTLPEENNSEVKWAISLNDLQKYEAIFNSLGPIDGRLSGNQCRPVLLNSQLPKGRLAKIWDLADIDADGFLDRSEFCVALHLVYRSLQNDSMPERLPLALVPPEKRILRQAGTRSEELPSTHPPPLNWSSRASSVSSLNIQQHQSSSPPTTRNIMPKSLFERNVEKWHVEDLNQFELEFSGLDKDHDGFVSGNDVRDSFLKFGLSQSNLARIWAHVDVQKSGRLDLEQYAKCILLIHECQEGLIAKTSVSIASPTPPMTLTRRDSQISNNSSSGIRPLMAENPRAQELSASIEDMQQKRRKAEEDLFQLTLEATVKQLRVQRVEANKRLNDLDTRVAKLETICSESQHRLEEEEARLLKRKADILQARENSGREDIVLEQLRAEAARRNDKLLSAKTALEQQNTRFVAFVDELTQVNIYIF